MAMWTISAAGGSNAAKLAGWHIIQTPDQNPTTYQLTEGNVNSVKATVGPTPPPPTSGTLTFSFSKDSASPWTITATLPLTAGTNFSGNWTSPPIPEEEGAPTGPQSGTYTATADGTIDAEAASSANA